MSSGAVQKQRQASGREDDTAYLHRAERPWLPKHRLRGSSEETDRRELIGRFRAILNKVTVQTLEVLAQQARGLEVKGEEDLRGMVDLLHSQVGVCVYFHCGMLRLDVCLCCCGVCWLAIDMYA